ncbi:MAG: hypothetical protein ACRDT6_23715 [Micromonosporaceae bacterium]
MTSRRIALLPLTALAVVLSLLAGTPALAAPSPLTASNFRLKATSYSSLIDDLDARLPNVSVPTVVNSANRYGSVCSPPARSRVAAFCWNSGDNGTTAWYPQGITSTADAYGAGTYDGETVILVSWYDHADDGISKGVRVSFVDWSSPSSPKYRHVLLVEPYRRSDGRPSFRSVNIHAGGMFWYGYYLYVADTSYGFRVFDLRHLWQVSTGNKSIIGWQSNGTYHAFDYQYVLPQAFRYLQSTVNGYSKLRFSFASLDRTSTPDSVVMGEYGYPGGGTRLVRFGIDYRDRKLRTDSDGYARGTQAYNVSFTSMQGATSVNGEFLVSTSDGSSNAGDLISWTPGRSPRYYYDSMPIGPEDLSYWGPRDQLWSLSEYPGRRNVYAMRASAF